MKVVPTPLKGLLIIEPDVYKDDRGYFLESWNSKGYESIGIVDRFVQDNVSFSRRHVLRGLHFQNPHPQGKLVSVLQGEVYDVAVDLRRNSTTFGKWFGVSLSSQNRNQLYIPDGFAHGFVVLSETALFSYKCTEFYDRQSENTIVWNDPDVGIEWPIDKPIVSEKDRNGLQLHQINSKKLF